MTTPCFSDKFQSKLLTTLDKYQKKIPTYNGYAKFANNGQIFDDNTKFMPSSNIETQLKSAYSIPIDKKDGFMTFDGNGLSGIPINLSSSDGIQKLSSTSNNWMQKPNNQDVGICMTFNDNVISSKFSIDDTSLPNEDILWTAKKIANYPIENATVQLISLPSIDLDSKQNLSLNFEPNKILQCDLQSAKNIPTSSQISNKFQIPNIVNKIQSSLLPRFASDGQIESSLDFPKKSFTDLYVPPIFPTIDPTLYQDKSLLVPNEFAVLSADGKLSSMNIPASDYIQKLQNLGIPKPASDSNGSLINTFGIAVGKQPFVTADLLTVDKSLVCSGTFSKVEGNAVVFDTIIGNIPVIDNKTVILDGTFSIEIFLNCSNPSNSVSILNTTFPVNPFHFKTLVRHKGNWSLTLVCDSLLSSKFVIISV